MQPAIREFSEPPPERNDPKAAEQRIHPLWNPGTRFKGKNWFSPHPVGIDLSKRFEVIR